MARQLLRFAVVGALSTVVHLGLFAVLAVGTVPAQVANLVALLLATAANTAANRRWTFGITGNGATRHQVQGYALFGVTWVLTALGLWAVTVLAPASGTSGRTAAVAIMTAVAAVVRFVAMRAWMFRPGGTSGDGSARQVPAGLGS
jgi:putative flippase GtrA